MVCAKKGEGEVAGRIEGEKVIPNAWECLNIQKKKTALLGEKGTTPGKRKEKGRI